MKLSKLLALLLSVLMIVSVLAACSSGSTETPTESTKTEAPADDTKTDEPADDNSGENTSDTTEEGVEESDLYIDPNKTTFEELVNLMVDSDMAKVASEGAAEKVRTNLAEYLEKGIVK